MVFKFTIDNITNKYLPGSIVPKLPRPLQHFLGGNSHNPATVPDYIIWLDILVSSFCGIALLEGLFKSHNVFTDHHNAPMIIASYGATAILCFNAVGVPLAQPRNIIFGHFVSALIGVCISKLFGLSEAGEKSIWAGGALSVGLASVAMLILNCVHPPAGASALMPCVDEGIRSMSWWYLPAHLVSSVLITCVALITVNVVRRYPQYWWSPVKKIREENSVKEDTFKEDNIEKEDQKLPEPPQIHREGTEVHIKRGVIKIPIATTDEDLVKLKGVYWSLYPVV